LVDRVVDCGPGDFAAEVGRLAARLAALPGSPSRIAAKKAELERQECGEPLAAFRERELTRMRRTFDDPDAPYHALRRAFVHKRRPQSTPPHLGLAATTAARTAAGADRSTRARVTGTALEDLSRRPDGWYQES
ncbi:hydrogenase maturation protein, partial [Streptomyces mirabilis]